MLRRYALQMDLVHERGRDERVVFDDLNGGSMLFERQEEIAYVTQAMKRVAFDRLDGIADEINDTYRIAAAENVAVDFGETIHDERERVEVEETAERVRLEFD